MNDYSRGQADARLFYSLNPGEYVPRGMWRGMCTTRSFEYMMGWRSVSG